MPSPSIPHDAIPTTAQEARARFPGFYANRGIKVLADARRWTVSGMIGDLEESVDSERFAKARKAPIDMRHLLETGRVRGAWARDQQCLVDLDELTTGLPQAANAAYYLRMQVDGLIMVDIEPDCPEDITSALLRLPRVLYAETSMSGRGYHLLMHAPTNLHTAPTAARKTVLREEHGWYELLMEHWVTFTRRPIPTQRLLSAHAQPQRDGDPSRIEDVFADLAAKAAATSAADPTALQTGEQMPEIPLSEQIVTGMIVTAHDRMREPSDFHHDLSRWEFSVLGKLYTAMRSELAKAEGIGSGGYSDIDRTWLLYEAATRILPARDKHTETRHGRPYLLDRAATIVADRRAQEKAERARQSA